MKPVPMKLNVEFMPQTDNKVQPDRTCNTSSCAMAGKFLGGRITTDDEYWKVLSKYGDSTDHSAQTKALKEVGVSSEWRVDGSYSDIEQQLMEGNPVVIGILHRGTDELPGGGHMIVVIGMNNNLNFRCHDPYGSMNNNYQGDVYQGRDVVYGRRQLSKRWMVDGVGSGWYRKFL
jgi:Peptidase_C39 like family